MHAILREWTCDHDHDIFLWLQGVVLDKHFCFHRPFANLLVGQTLRFHKVPTDLLVRLFGVVVSEF